MPATPAHETITLATLGHVVGGAMSGREALCRGAGALIGGAAGVGANLLGGAVAANAAGTGLMEAASATSLAGGIVNGASTSSPGETVSDMLLGAAGAIPMVGAPFAGYTMGKLGWKAGGAACGYGWSSRG